MWWHFKSYSFGACHLRVTVWKILLLRRHQDMHCVECFTKRLFSQSCCTDGKPRSFIKDVKEVEILPIDKTVNRKSMLRRTKFLTGSNSPAVTLRCDITSCDGLDVFKLWRIIGCGRCICAENCMKEEVQLELRSCATRINQNEYSKLVIMMWARGLLRHLIVFSEGENSKLGALLVWKLP